MMFFCTFGFDVSWRRKRQVHAGNTQTKAVEDEGRLLVVAL